MMIDKAKCFMRKTVKILDWRWCKLCLDRSKCETYNNRKGKK